MSRLSVQAPSAVIMVRPHHFAVNAETASDNSFQQQSESDERPAATAYDEITRAAAALETHGVVVHMFEDRGTATPDSVFPNNWFSTHGGGHLAIYPMKAESRRLERRFDIIEMLKAGYRVQDVIDYSGLEPDGLFLEGTGSMVLDHLDRVAYAALSDRTDSIALERFCTHFNFEPMAFDAQDEAGLRVYHTNVLMCVATEFALLGLDMINNAMRRDEIVRRLERSGRRVIGLTNRQIRNFAGNALELQGQRERILAVSTTALSSLDAWQIEEIERSALPVAFDIPTIEKSGGSIRCTLAGVHLSPR